MPVQEPRRDRSGRERQHVGREPHDTLDPGGQRRLRLSEQRSGDRDERDVQDEPEGPREEESVHRHHQVFPTRGRAVLGRHGPRHLSRHEAASATEIPAPSLYPQLQCIRCVRVVPVRSVAPPSVYSQQGERV